MRTSRGLTDAQREQRREQDRQRLHEAARQLLTSEGWQRWITIRAKGRARPALLEQPAPRRALPPGRNARGRVKAWLLMGYCVRAGEKAIRIIAPMPIKPQDEYHAESAGLHAAAASIRAVSGSAPVVRARIPRIAGLDSRSPGRLSPPPSRTVATRELFARRGLIVFGAPLR